MARDIARHGDGRFRLQRGCDVLATASTLGAILSFSAAFLPDRADPYGGWYVAHKPLTGPVYDWVNGERRSSDEWAAPNAPERRSGWPPISADSITQTLASPATPA